MIGLGGLGDGVLLSIADALDAGRIDASGEIEPISLRSVTGAADAASALEELRGKGVGAAGLAAMCRLVVAERQRVRAEAPRVSLVWTGPDAAAETETIDTESAMRRLFERATRSVVVSSYSLGSGKTLFAPLAQRMAKVPGLEVTMIFDIMLCHADCDHAKDAAAFETCFRDMFLRKQWPKDARPPTLYWDPRTRHNVGLNRRDHISFHAKCVVVDDEVALVTSANTSGAAQTRNIEAGVLIERSTVPRDLAAQFRKLIREGVLDPIDGVFVR